MAFSRHATTPVSGLEQQQGEDKVSPVLQFEGFRAVCTELAGKKAMAVLTLARCLTPKGHRSVSLAGSSDGQAATPASGRTSFAAYNLRTAPAPLSISASTPAPVEEDEAAPPPAVGLRRGPIDPAEVEGKSCEPDGQHALCVLDRRHRDGKGVVWQRRRCGLCVIDLC